MAFFCLWLYGIKKEIRTYIIARKSLKPTERVQKRRTSEAWLSFFSDERSVMGLFVVMVVWMKTEKKTATLIFI